MLAAVFRGKSITISCTDAQRSASFYQGVLGATPLPGDGAGCRWYRLGHLVFSIVPNAECRSPVSFPRDAATMFWLEVDDLSAARQRLTDAGVAVVDAPQGGPSFIIADPDGLLIEVWQRS